MTDIPALTQFRLEWADNGLVHLVFDCPGRTMNVFSEEAIGDIGAVAQWLGNADVTGLLIRSGKANAFCAGADLTELGVAYDRISSAPTRTRFDMAYDHFAPLGRALRALEVAGKPIAIAIAGLALGGGCELALAGHYRVMVDDPRIAMGLPETLVGLLPGAGGTQRLPRLVGVATALPILLDGARLSGQAAMDAGLVDRLVAAGEEIAACEAWLFAAKDARQPWDRRDWVPPSPAATTALIAPVRAAMLAASLGHYPALTAVLDCVEFGLPQSFDGGYRTEMAVFANLIRRREARDMIQTMFLAKTRYDRLERKGELPEWATAAAAAARNAVGAAEDREALAAAGFAGVGTLPPPLRTRTGAGYWVEEDQPLARRARGMLETIGAEVSPFGVGRSDEDRRLIDYAVIAAAGYPAYLGGPLAFAAAIRED